MLIFWIIVFIVSLAVLIKGSGWLIQSAEKIGLAFGLSPFIIGITIVSIGTSFPELVSSFVATFQGVTEVVVANAVGSNIANILLVVGISAIISKELVIKKNSIDLELPLLAVSTVLLLGVVWDKQITFGESILMVFTYCIYLLYAIYHKDSDVEITERDIKSELDHPKLEVKDLFLLIMGVVGLVFGAQYLIESLVELSTMLKIGTGVIAITAVAVGTSLPELFVSARAAFNKKSEIALGNILGSNIFNSLVVVGLPGLFRVLPIDNQTFRIGIPVMAMATLLFIVSGIFRRIHVWEGAFFLSFYILFIVKLFNLF